MEKDKLSNKFNCCFLQNSYYKGFLKVEVQNIFCLLSLLIDNPMIVEHERLSAHVLFSCSDETFNRRQSFSESNWNHFKNESRTLQKLSCSQRFIAIRRKLNQEKYFKKVLKVIFKSVLNILCYVRTSVILAKRQTAFHSNELEQK